MYFFFNRSLAGIFTDNKVVIEVAGEWLQILSYSYFLYGWWMVASQAFNGSGDTRTPTKINFVFFWLFQIPLAYMLAISLNWGYSGVFWAVFFSETAASIFTVWLFSRGRWKMQTV